MHFPSTTVETQFPMMRLYVFSDKVDDRLTAISQRVILQLERCSPKIEASDGSGQRGDWVYPHPSLLMSHQAEGS